MMDPFEVEFGGVKALEGWRQDGRGRCTQPPSEVVVGPALPARVRSRGCGHVFDKSAKHEIGGVRPSITPRAGKIILVVKPRGSEFLGGVD
jgi:hypothetical protein